MTRRSLLRRLPGLTKFYGLRPVDFDEMTRREIEEYVTQMEQALSNP